MFVAFLFLIFYLAMQSLHNTLRIMKITTALRSMSKTIAAAANVPPEKMEEITAEWDKAVNRINEAAGVGAIALLGIAVFLIALWRQGHL